MRRSSPVAVPRFGGLCLAVCAALPAVGQEDARFAAVLARNPPAEDVACSYTTTTTDSEHPGETRTERHEAEVGTGSSADEGGSVMNFASVVVDLREFAALDLRVSQENADTVAFDFSPPPEEGEPEETMEENLRGTLVVGKPGLRPQSLVLALEEPFWPAPVARVKEFRFEMTFAVDPATNAVVIAQTATAIRGRAFFKRFDHEEQVVYGDFDCRRRAAKAISQESQESQERSSSGTGIG